MIFSDEDLRELKDEADFEVLFNHLGISYKKQGKMLDFICPFHNASHYGAAKYDIIKKKCKCFSCGKSFSPLDLIMQVKNLTLYEAAQELAKLEGKLQLYETCNKTVRTGIKRLTEEQRGLLGFKKKDIENIIGISEKNEPNAIYDTNKNFYYLLEKNKLTWNYLYNNFPDEYKNMVLRKANSRLSILSQEIAQLSSYIENTPVDDKTWFYKEVIALKQDEQKRIEEIVSLFINEST